MITPADSAPVAPEQMPASSFSITAPDPGASSVGPSAIAYGTTQPSGTVAGAVSAAKAAHTHSTGDLGTQPTIPTETSTGSHGGSFYDPPRDY